jgi:predicted adenine nucleotide alpha hydrolase (AANH) superfamily ATPase
MTESYYKLCLQELEKLKNRPHILLHSCCAPCSSWVITFLTKYFDITILYYNPNISPIEEYAKRKAEQIRLINEIEHEGKIDIIDCDYDNDIYESRIKGYEKCQERGERCTICFNLRLEKSAMIAKENNFDYFCSTLTVSPYKNAKLINEIGAELGKKYQVKWLYSDFKKNDGYKKSIELSKQYNLYRQDYCGCIYSKRKNVLD